VKEKSVKNWVVDMMTKKM